MSWIAVGGIAGSLGSAYMQSRGGDRAADAQRDANGLAIDEERRQYDQTREDMAPWRESGGWALGEQRNFLEGDYSGFMNSAPYQAAIRQGTAQLDAGAAAGGNLWGGGTDADRIQFGQDTAWKFADSYYDKLTGLSSTGYNSAGQLGQLGAASAGRVGGYLQDSGVAQASAYANTANAWGNGLNNAAGWWAYGQGRRNGDGG